MIKRSSPGISDLQGTLLSLLSPQGETEDVLPSALDQDAWENLVALGVQQRVLPLIFTRVQPFSTGVPPAIMEKLKAAVFRTSVRNLLFNREVANILARLHDTAIEVILLKGVYLANGVYPDTGLRPMADIDLLVKQDDIPPAIAALESDGYVADRPYFFDVDGKMHYHAPVMSKNGILVELHWNLTRDSNLDTINVEGLWQRARSVNLEIGSARVLGLSDLILHLAVHVAYGHRFHHQLLSFCDLDRVVRKFADEIDWEEIVRTCREWQAERGTFITFTLGKTMLGTCIPDEVLEKLRPPDWQEEILGHAMVSIFQEEMVLSENYVRLMQGATIGEKMKGLMNGLFPPRAVIAMEYGLSLTSWRLPYLYIPYAFERIKKYWRFAWRMARGDRLQERESLSAKVLRDWLEV